MRTCWCCRRWASSRYLDELRRDLKPEGFDYPHAVLCCAVRIADRHVAILSKRPFASVTPHTDLQFRYFGGKEAVKRGLLEATIETAAGDLTLFAVHLKSRFTDRADDPQSAVRRAGRGDGGARSRVETISGSAVARNF